MKNNPEWKKLSDKRLKEIMSNRKNTTTTRSNSTTTTMRSN